MRPLRLEMTAFGPFAETQVVDFRELGAAQLFLICGETGAGKSAILDGLCAALYGESSGGERSVAQLRSDHADPRVLTTLRLDFRVGEHAYRIERTPAQRRAKFKGEGHVDQAASATLWRLASDAPEALVAEVLAERKVREVDARVLGLVKLEVAQFRRVVVLPQGDFRLLLSADSQARERLLEKLFDTLVWKRVEDELARRTSELKAALRDAEQRRATLLGSEGETSLEVLRAKVEGHERALPHVDQAVREASARLREAMTRHATAQDLAARFEALGVERAREAALDAREPAVQRQREELRHAKAAESIAQAFDAATAAAEKYAARVNAEAVAQQALQRAGAQLEPLAVAATTAAAEHARRGERERERGEAQARVQAGREWMERVRAREVAESESAGADEARAQQEHTHHDTTQALEELSAQRATLADAPARHARAEAELAALTARLALHRRAARQEGELAQLEVELTQATQHELDAAAAHTDANATLRAVEAAMHAGHASILAQGLSDGEPCPVCGSPDHPAPALRDATTPSEAARATAERNVTRAREAHTAAAAQRAAAEATRDAKRAELEAQREPLGGETLAHVERQVAAAAEALAHAKASVQQLAALDARLLALGDRVRRTAAELDAARQTQVRAHAHLDAAKAEEATALGRLRGEPADVPAWTERVATLTAAIEAAEAAHARAGAQLANARQALTAAESAAESAATEREAAAAQRDQTAVAWAALRSASPFADDLAFTAARLAPARAAQLEAELKRHADERLALTTRLDAHLEALAGQSPPDLDALEREATAALAASEAATTHHANVQSAATRGRELVTQIELGLAETARQDGEYRALDHLSRVAGGHNDAKMNLHRFVLATFLEDVLTQANQHMQLTSQGRYELVRRASGGDARRAQGLDLDVHDHYTGEARPSTTLSGGEGFLAALALALGLADVVRAHFGGVPIETVFIDEGFGSLDPETLDLVIETLLRLQRTGRMVGIISHVPELRERVDVLLEVSKGVHGSTAKFRVPG